MDVILWIVLGAVAGFLAVLVMYRTIPDSPIEWAGAIIIGLIGGWLGGFLTDLADLESVSWLGSLIIAFVGALVLLVILRRLAPGK